MLHTMPDDVYDVIMKVHVRAPFRLIRAAAPYFRIKSSSPENRTIINVSSTTGLHGNVGQVKAGIDLPIVARPTLNSREVLTRIIQKETSRVMVFERERERRRDI